MSSDGGASQAPIQKIRRVEAGAEGWIARFFPPMNPETFDRDARTSFNESSKNFLW